MASSPSFTVRPVSPVLGAEITDLNLASGIDDSSFEALHEAFLRYGVLFFRDQDALSAEAQVALGRRWGPLHTHPAAPAEIAESSVFVIHTHQDSPVANGNGWHSDVSCEEEPPMATMLQIHVLPDSGGGDTLFASMEAAYAALDPGQRAALRGLVARHESEHVYRGRYANRGVDDSGTEFPWADHPVVRTHPETRRPSIYVNRAFTTQILDLNKGASASLLQQLFAHCERPEFQIRFTWRANDVALWDNRCLMHFAVWDYWPNERKGHRVSIRGDRPMFDADAPEPPPSLLRISDGSLTFAGRAPTPP